MLIELYKQTILVVDDEHFMRMLVMQSLNSIGVGTVKEAENAASALKVLAKTPINLLICDIEMDGMSGLELVKEIRTGRTAAPKNLKVIFLTGLSDISILTFAEGLDIQGFLTKPVSAVQLKNKIEVALKSDVVLRMRDHYQDLSLTGEPRSSVNKTASRVSEWGVESVDASRKGIIAAQVATAASVNTRRLMDLKEGMVLDQELTANGAVLIKKGMDLKPFHIMVINDMRLLIDQKEVPIR